MLAALLLIAAAPPADPPAFGPIFTDWRSVNREAMEREQTAEQERQAPAVPVAQARELGARVGELVASGDCEGGERLAREAGDFPLLRAVRAHCRRPQPAAQRPQ